ncbi:hypothetical protein PAXRUDRAFT_834768 [Paxillus rubicundulus Ve08.2h10]|uniref:Uncharacterized protein n=1 Tax=Paxillus rubicundulus Ve08.2h10 TaxID=930991 RepID=A0A0D0C4G4_9AGAM|nr:hypothetical protein PAXRUDRAFT_834768 [Paxillus rubicundulus Ve08.2h10]
MLARNLPLASRRQCLRLLSTNSGDSIAGWVSECFPLACATTDMVVEDIRRAIVPSSQVDSASKSSKYREAMQVKQPNFARMALDFCSAPGKH